MSRTVILSVLLAGLIVAGSSTPIWAAQLDVKLNPNTESSPFTMNYQRTIFIEYPNGGVLSDELRDKEWTISGTADMSNPGVQGLVGHLNAGIVEDGSQANISDLNVYYEFYLKSREAYTSIDYKIVLDGTLANYVITKDSQRALVDLGWRGLSTSEEIMIDGNEINIPLNLLKNEEPAVYHLFVGTEVEEEVLGRHLINADFILEQPLVNWHFLFDPTGVSVDAGTFGLSDAISGAVISRWTMGESSIREGRQVEKDFEAEVRADQLYTVRSVQSADQANLHIIGFGTLDVLDGVEIIGVTPTPPEGTGSTSTGDFPIMIVYGMASMAAVAGIVFFFISSRSLKNEKQGQQGIDPSRLVGHQTSASSGGYQTNRGEAQLVDDTNYQQSRSVYDDNTEQQTPPPPPQTTTPAPQEAACGCAASAEMGSECDCQMQSSCLCDASCACTADICKEQASSMS